MTKLPMQVWYRTRTRITARVSVWAENSVTGLARFASLTRIVAQVQRRVSSWVVGEINR